MKVKVSKEVAEKFKMVETAENIIEFLHRLYCSYSGCATDWMEKHNLTDDDLINAYKYGWEVEYEFQVGDVIKWFDNEDKENLRTVSKTSGDRVYFTSGICDWMSKKECILVSKSTNREDLKQC